MEKQKKDKLHLRDMISTEFNLIKTSETIGGALTHLGAFFAKLRRLPHINYIIASAEAELAAEDRIAFENLEKAVLWFHAKIKLLLLHVKWAPDSFEMDDVNALLNFHTLSFNANGYVGSLHFALRRLFSKVAEEEMNRPLFEGWMRTERKTGYAEEIFDWPEYVDKSLKSLLPKQQLYQWKERADTSLSCLLRFLKILSLYPTFVPLTLPARPTIDSLPKNLLQLEERRYQAAVGYYLSAFKSPDVAKHPLSIIELIKLIDRFLYMLEQKLEFDVSEDSNSPQVNIVINQFFFFTQAAKEATVPNPTPTEQAPVSPVATSQRQPHPNTAKCTQDVMALIPYAKKGWLGEMDNKLHPHKISKEELATKILEKLPTHVYLHSKGKKHFPRMLRALKLTDPRIYDGDGGRCKGLRPHWEKFEWVES